MAFSFDNVFEKEAKIFSNYAKEKGINLENCENKLSLKVSETLNDEEFEIKAEETITVFANTSKGMSNALATLLGAIKPSENGFEVDLKSLKKTPQMPYRGLHLDLARQWHPVEYILKYIDLCYLNCATHLQLHFTDNESFTLPMKAFLNLSTKGRTYTFDEIKKIRAYANERNITLVPEVDLPGHTAQFCKTYPEIFGTLNILPASEKVFKALKTILEEVLEMFPESPLIHLGGDEAMITAWEKCEETKNYMKENGIKDIHEMYAEYIRIVTDMIIEMGRTPVVWEGFSKEYNDRISKKTIVICWESLYQPAYDLATSGFTIINCSWKPLYVVTYFKHWTPEEISKWNPYNWQNWWEESIAYPDGYTIDKETSNVIGAQMCVWGDKLMHLQGDEIKKGLDDEFDLVKERFPALIEKLF